MAQSPKAEVVRNGLDQRQPEVRRESFAATSQLGEAGIVGHQIVIFRNGPWRTFLRDTINLLQSWEDFNRTWDFTGEKFA